MTARHPLQRLARTLALGSALAAPLAASASLVNGSFEALNSGFAGTTGDWNNNYVITDASNLPGWRTTASDNMVEVWQQRSGLPGTMNAASGSNFAELNANMVATLFQDVTGIAAGSLIGWQLAHRGRSGDDTLRLLITDEGRDGTYGTADDTVLVNQLFTDGNLAWGNYSGTGVVALGNTLRFSLVSVAAAGGNLSYGNFVDAADLGVGVGATARPSLAVPEPATWLLTFTALGAAAWSLRRRRWAVPARSADASDGPEPH